MTFFTKNKIYFFACLFIISKTINGQIIHFFKPPFDKSAIDSVNQKSTFYIQGIIEGADSGRVMLYSDDKSVDTFSIKSGKIEIMGICKFPELISLRVLGDYYFYSFFVEHAHLTLSLNMAAHIFIVQGGRENNLRNLFDEMNKSLITQYSDYYEKVNKAQSLADLDMYLAYSDSFSHVETEWIRNIEQQIAKQSYGYYLLNSIDAALVSFGYFDKRLALLKMLPDSLRNSPMGKKTYHSIKDRESKSRELINKKAYVFELYDTLAKRYSLSQYRGKYVLIDFWASWCVPCLKELPLLRKIYSTIEPDHVVFISISVDKIRDAWIKALSKYEIPWVSLLADTESINRYHIESVPNKILVDPKGKIIGSSLTLDDLYKKLEDRAILNREVKNISVKTLREKTQIGKEGVNMGNILMKTN